MSASAEGSGNGNGSDATVARPDPAALTVAMAVAPGVYARNRMFAFFKDPEIRRARDRAAQLRGIARHIAGSHGEVSGVALERIGDETDSAREGRFKLRYRVTTIRFERAVELDALEAACVTYLVARAGSPVMVPTPEERTLLEASLRRLATGLMPSIDLMQI